MSSATDAQVPYCGASTEDEGACERPQHHPGRFHFIFGIDEVERLKARLEAVGEHEAAEWVDAAFNKIVDQRGLLNPEPDPFGWGDD